MIYVPIAWKQKYTAAIIQENLNQKLFDHFFFVLLHDVYNVYILMLLSFFFFSFNILHQNQKRASVLR